MYKYSQPLFCRAYTHLSFWRTIISLNQHLLYYYVGLTPLIITQNLNLILHYVEPPPTLVLCRAHPHFLFCGAYSIIMTISIYYNLEPTPIYNYIESVHTPIYYYIELTPTLLLHRTYPHLFMQNLPLLHYYLELAVCVPTPIHYYIGPIPSIITQTYLY